MGAGMVFPVVGGIGLAAGAVGSSGATVSEDLRSGLTPAVTTITDSTGAPLAYLYDQFRIPVSNDRIAPAMKAAAVAIEDRRFYDHGGVDPIGTARALVNDANGGAQQGGSTITQQYVKNYELYVAATTDAQRRAAVAPSIARKVTEAELAVQLDNELPKDEILGRYLDVVYFGHGAYGVGAAAKVYFGTTADALTVAQSALLAGMVQSPTAYDPTEHPDAAKARRDTVIAAMAQQGSIDAPQAAAATAAPLGTVPQPAAPEEGCTGAGDAGYFCLYVERYLEAAGLPADKLEGGGYTIRTTLDRAALGHLKAAIDAADPPDNPHVADVMAIVAPGQDSHPVVALAANRPFGNGPGQSAFGLPSVPENLGAGSVYKIFTAAAALDQGVAGIDSVLDVPPSGATLPNYIDGNGRPLAVRNAGNYPGQLSLTDALAQSPNTAFVELEGRTGVPPVVDMAVKLGMTSLAQPARDGGPVARRRDEDAAAGVVHPRRDPDQRAGAGQRRRHAGQPRPVVPAGPDRGRHRPRRRRRARHRAGVHAGRPARARRHPHERVEQGRPARRHLGSRGGRRRVEPPDRREDRHHPGVQVGRVRRCHPAAGRRGDRVRRLPLPEADLRR